MQGKGREVEWERIDAKSLLSLCPPAWSDAGNKEPLFPRSREAYMYCCLPTVPSFVLVCRAGGRSGCGRGGEAGKR